MRSSDLVASRSGTYGDHRLLEEVHVLGHVPDGGASLVGDLLDLAKIHRDLGAGCGRDSSPQAVLVLFGEPAPGDDVGARVGAPIRSMTAMSGILTGRKPRRSRDVGGIPGRRAFSERSAGVRRMLRLP